MAEDGHILSRETSEIRAMMRGIFMALSMMMTRVVLTRNKTFQGIKNNVIKVLDFSNSKMRF